VKLHRADGLLEASATLGVFAWALQSRDVSEARSVAFTTLVFCELFRSFAARSVTRTFWEVGALTNLRLVGVVVVSVFVQLGIHYIPATKTFFEIGMLSPTDCALTILVGLVPVTVLEGQKLVRRAARKRSVAS
jgi:Ca2+-transporting ATPase